MIRGQDEVDLGLSRVQGIARERGSLAKLAMRVNSLCQARVDYLYQTAVTALYVR